MGDESGYTEWLHGQIAADLRESNRPRCGGSGEIVAGTGTRQDSFGNWDTEEYDCPGCPDCSEVCPTCGGDGRGEPLSGVGAHVPCGTCNGSGWIPAGSSPHPEAHE